MAGADVHSEIAGAGEPLVLLNGIMMTTQSWALSVPRLSQSYRCVLHDFRGQLRSLHIPPPYALGQHVDDLAALLDRLGIESAHFVGTSYGGEVAMLFALAHPERVRSLTLIACVSHIEEPLREKVLRWRDAAPEMLYEVSAPDNFSPRFLTPAVLNAGRERLRAYPRAFFPAFAALCDAFLELDITDRLHEIRAPALVVAGALDVLKPVHYSRTIADRIRNAELRVIEDAGHAVVIEKADAVNELVLDWLAS